MILIANARHGSAQDMILLDDGTVTFYGQKQELGSWVSWWYVLAISFVSAAFLDALPSLMIPVVEFPLGGPC